MFESLIKEAEKIFTEEEIKFISKAHDYAALKHEGVFRDSNEPYITHPEHVAYILFNEMHLHDSASIAAAFLHDVVEDTNTTLLDIKDFFGEEVMHLVEGVTKIKDITFTNKNTLEQYNTCLLLRKTLDDYRIILIKLADRLHNMRTLEYKKETLRRKISKKEAKSLETLQIFVPLADRIGAYLVKVELEDLVFKYLHPREYESYRAMKMDYVYRYQEEIENIKQMMIDYLDSKGIKTNITISFKNLYNLFLEMQKGQKLSTIHDLIAYKIETPTTKDCILKIIYLPLNLMGIEQFIRLYVVLNHQIVLKNILFNFKWLLNKWLY